MMTWKGNFKLMQKKHNCSTEEEIYRILSQALCPIEKQKNFGSHLHQQIIEISNGIELGLPARSLPRTAPDFLENTK